jgi:[ribosomal protein S18]-alanine N-acetyltransferase
MLAQSYLASLTIEDIPGLQQLEESTKLSFWGEENYRKFLAEFPEYFGFKVVVLTEENSWRMVGFFLARALFENLEILKVGVSPDRQRCGLATQLMEAAYAEGIRRRCTRCFLEVRKSNQGAIDFYLRHQFKFAGTRLNYYSNPIEDAWIMERTL